MEREEYKKPSYRMRITREGLSQYILGSVSKTPVRKIRGLNPWSAGADLNGQMFLSHRANVTIDC